MIIRPIFILRLVGPRIVESRFRNHSAKKLDGALRKSTSFVLRICLTQTPTLEILSLKIGNHHHHIVIIMIIIIIMTIIIILGLQPLAGRVEVVGAARGARRGRQQLLCDCAWCIGCVCIYIYIYTYVYVYM